MRLTYVHNSEIPGRGASTVQVMRMCAAFARLGCEVELIVPHHGDADPMSQADALSYYGCRDRFALHRLPLGRAGWFGFAHAASGRAKERMSDLVFGRCIRSCTAAAWRGMPVMHEAHGPMEAYSKSGRLAFRALARSPNLRRLVVINQALAGYYAETFPSLTNAPLVAASGTDPVKGAAPKTLSPEDSGTRLRIGYVGSLFPGKGMELISEIARLSDHDYVIVGGDDELIARWKAETSSNVTFRGFMPNREVAAEIAALDIALAPYGSRVSGAGTSFDLARWMSPLKLFEYMAHARAIIASDLPAIREVVTPGKDVMLCSPDDPAAWVAAIDALARDKALRASLGRAALQTFLREYTWEQRARKILEAA